MTLTASSLLHPGLLIPAALGAALALTAYQALRRPRIRRFVLLLTATTAMVIATGCLVTTRDAALLVSSVVLAELARAILTARPRREPDPQALPAADPAPARLAGRLAMTNVIAVIVLISGAGHADSTSTEK
jgi:uncharacterized membrane protein YfcA